MGDLKINVKYGIFELQVEGNSTEVMKIFDETKKEIIVKMFNNHALNPVVISDKTQQCQISKVQETAKPISKMSMSTVATKLNAKTATEMMVAALAFLTITSEEGKFFSLKDINDAMKSATYHYKKNQSNNLKRDIGRLVKIGHISVHGNDQYTFPIDKLQEVRSRLD